MQAGGPFEITWSKNGELLFREIVRGPSLDDAQVGAWLDLPRIVSMTGTDADTIELHDTATGQTIIEDVPQAGPVAPLSAAMPHLLTATGLALVFGVVASAAPLAIGAMAGFLLDLLGAAVLGAVFAWLNARDREARGRKRWPDRTHLTDTPSRRTPGRPRLRRVVVARLSIVKHLLVLTPIAGAGIALAGFALFGRLQYGAFAVLDLLWLGLGTIMIMLTWQRLWLILFHRGAALWIEGGEVVFVSRRQRAPIWDIASIVIGPYREGRQMPRKSVILSGEEGRMVFPVGEISKPDEAVARLKMLLRLPMLRHEETDPWLLS